VAARLLVAALFLTAAGLAVRTGGWYLLVGLPAGAFGVLVGLAALFKQPGCEVNLVWSRMLRQTPIDCFLLGPIDRWERGRSR